MSSWIIRAGKGGIRADEWISGGYIAIYWDFNGEDIASLSKEQLKSLYRKVNPEATKQVVATHVGMVYRFSHEIVEGSNVVMYDPSTRLYHLGIVTGECLFVLPLKMTTITVHTVVELLGKRRRLEIYCLLLQNIL